MQDFQEVFTLTLTQAKKRFTQLLESAEPEYCEATEVRGRVLARDVLADRELPPYNRVAVDGYACRRDDLDGAMKLLGTVAAGESSDLEVKPGTCVKVMTGGVLPPGAEMVAMVEHTEVDAEGMVRFNGSDGARKSGNVSYRGEDVGAGELVLPKGSILDARHVALLASVGISHIPVVPAPKIGILSTGDEVVEPQVKPLPHQIRNANALQMKAQLMDFNLEANYYGIAPDDPKAFKQSLSRAQKENDLVLMSGGVSMGDFDFAPEAMAANGYEIQYSRVAVKPGKPSTFAVSEEGDLFGLPGNPVSCFVIFEILVKPYLYSFMGSKYRPPAVYAELAEDFTRSKTAREEWILVKIEADGRLKPVRYHGSGHFQALAGADGMIKIERGQSQLKRGTNLAVRLF